MPKRFRRPYRTRPRIGPRIVVAFVPLTLAFTLLILRSAQLQFMQQPKLERFMQRAQPSSITIAQHNRATVFDRHGRELAVNVPVKSLYIDPLRFKEQHNFSATLRTIAKKTGVELKTLKRRLNRASRFFWVKRHLSPYVAKEIEALKASGVHFISESKRFYPNGSLAAHLLGFTNLDGDGIEGLEFAMDDLLRGEKSTLRAQRDAKGRRLLIGGIEKKGRPGKQLYLTIDSVLQHAVERELERAQQENQASAALALMMHPHTGEILAMASHPTFDPNRYREYSRQSWRNRVITDIFEPGSTFKSFVIAHAMQEGILARNDRFFCKAGSLAIQSRIINEEHRHEWLTTAEILKYSSNIGAAKIGLLLGSKRMKQMLNRFGFGEKSHIGLPGESAGLTHPTRHWTDYDVASAAFGQGIGVTGLQLIRGFSSLLNGGYLLQPTVLSHAMEGNRRIELQHKHRILRKTVNTHVSTNMRAMLTTVIEPKGTGFRAALAHHSVGGKTGTAQRFDPVSGTYPENNYTSSFIGYLPAENPQLVILVVVDQPQGKLTGGGGVAAPVFRRIAQLAAEHLNIKPDKTAESLQAGIPTRKLIRRVAATTDTLNPTDLSKTEHLQGLTIREVLRLTQKNGIEVSVRGSGFATGKIHVDKNDSTGKQKWIVYFEPVAKRNL